MQHLQIKTLQQENIILKHQLDVARDTIDEFRQEKENLIDDIRELREKLEKLQKEVIPVSKIKTEFTQEEIKIAGRHDP